MILPDAALAQHIAITGRTGSGKTFAAKGFVEHLLDLGRRVCIVDPTDAWFGLRSSADGGRPGYPVIVFGGDHADVPINAHSGAALAEFVATQNAPSIIGRCIGHVYGGTTRPDTQGAWASALRAALSAALSAAMAMEE